jgi:hypothetical protein
MAAAADITSFQCSSFFLHVLVGTVGTWRAPSTRPSRWVMGGYCVMCASNSRKRSNNHTTPLFSPLHRMAWRCRQRPRHPSITTPHQITPTPTPTQIPKPLKPPQTTPKHTGLPSPGRGREPQHLLLLLLLLRCGCCGCVEGGPDAGGALGDARESFGGGVASGGEPAQGERERG